MVTSYDGNGGDLETYFEIPFETWKRIGQGADITLEGLGAYESVELFSSWHFKDRLVTIWQSSEVFGGAECAIDKSVEELSVL